MPHPTVIDSISPRGKAAFHTLLPAAAFLIGGTPGGVILALTALAMTVSVLFGPKVSIFGRLFNQVIRPRLSIGDGSKEQAAPHRFAEAVGAVFLLAASGALVIGSPGVGWTLALIVSALAALNWLGGICVGCEMYLLIQKLRARALA